MGTKTVGCVPESLLRETCAEVWVFAVIVIFALLGPRDHPTLTLFLVRVLRYQMLSCCLSRMFLSPFIVTPTFSDLDGGLCEAFYLLAPSPPSSGTVLPGFPMAGFFAWARSSTGLEGDKF